MKIAASTLTEIKLCPLGTVPKSSPAVTIEPTNPMFAKLTAALSGPDATKTPGTMCALYANLPQIVIGRTAAGAVQIHIPVDGCDHYLSRPLAALTAARDQT